MKLLNYISKKEQMLDLLHQVNGTYVRPIEAWWRSISRLHSHHLEASHIWYDQTVTPMGGK